MYRINLYREYFEKRRRGRQRAVRAGVLTGIIGVGVFFLITLVLSGVLLGERARDLRGEVERLSSHVRAGTRPQSELDLARETVRIRDARVDWSPKVAALSQQIDSRLQLIQMTGQSAGMGRPARLSLIGIWQGADTPMEPVSRFMERLRSDPRISQDFPDIELGTVQGGESNRFQITCGPARTGGGS
jgi:hypothetical protein